MEPQVWGFLTLAITTCLVRQMLVACHIQIIGVGQRLLQPFRRHGLLHTRLTGPAHTRGAGWCPSGSAEVADTMLSLAALPDVAANLRLPRQHTIDI